MPLQENRLGLKFLLFIPFFALAFYAFFKAKQYRLQSKRQAINQFVGKQFPKLPIVDKQGSTTSLVLNSTGNTIIDFWFKSCPGCFTEMKQFEEVLKGKEKQVSIISISIDPADTWKNTLNGEVPAYDFITHPVDNWHHLLLKYSEEDAYSKNAQQLSQVLGVTGFPSYFVLDKKGTIIDTPPSAVNYIKTSLNNQNAFIVFATNPATWRSLQIIVFIMLTLLIYHILFNTINDRLNRKGN